MKSHIKVEMSVEVMRNMSVKQFQALQDNIIGEGRWETFDPATEVLHVSGHGDYIGVTLDHGFFVGIEKDGYTHS